MGPNLAQDKDNLQTLSYSFNAVKATWGGAGSTKLYGNEKKAAMVRQHLGLCAGVAACTTSPHLQRVLHPTACAFDAAL